MTTQHFFAICARLVPDKYAPALESATTDEAREAIIRAVGTLMPGTNMPRGPVCASYPNVPPEIAAKLILGEAVGEGLTRAERHQWLTDGATEEPHIWLLRGTSLESRHVTVSRWLLKVLADPKQNASLHRRDRGGESLAAHTMDLYPEDCEGGVNEAIARRADRMATEEFGAEKLCQPPTWFRSLGGRARLLDTAAGLQREGTEMAHCVGGYARQVKDGRCYIVSIRGWGYRSTCEYDRDGKIVQHLAKANTKPNPVCHKLAEMAVKKKRSKKHDRS